jgi:hypothetical protein
VAQITDVHLVDDLVILVAEADQAAVVVAVVEIDLLTLQ